MVMVGGYFPVLSPINGESEVRLKHDINLTALCSYKTAKTRIPVFKVEFHPLFTVTTIKTRSRLATALNHGLFATILAVVLATGSLRSTRYYTSTS